MRRYFAAQLLILAALFASTGCDPNYPFTIDTVTPHKGPTSGGTIVTIYSKGITGTTAVLFGGVASPDVKVINDLVLQAVTPPGPSGTVDVVLYDSRSAKNLVIPGAFTYEDPPAPAPTPLIVSSVLPATGLSSGGTDVTLLGTGFEPGMAVVFGDAGAKGITVVNGQVIAVTTPPHAAGPVDVTVIAPNGQLFVIPGGFVFGDPTPPPPLLIGSVQPSKGPASGGTTVTLLGAQFRTGMAVLFGDMAATTVQVINSQIATATSPAHAVGIVDVTVIDDQAMSTKEEAYEYQDDGPRIDSVTPSNGPTTGGTQITITGDGFTANAAVLFGALAASNVHVVNSQLITAVSPAQSAGSVDIAVNCNGQTRMSPAAFTYLPVPPPEVSITSVDPASGPVGGGTDVTIRGTGFVPGTAVLFGNLSATDVIVVNDQIIRAVSPAAESSGLVRIALLFSGTQIERSDAFEYTGTEVDTGLDSDGDGLTDYQETHGWEVWVDFFGFGFGQDTFGNITRYTVTSDPFNPDSDGDGLGDRLEFLNRSDPMNPDTDGDGLLDGEEYNQWFTSPISVDTDGDARGPNGDLAPSAVLFDGMELYRDYTILGLPPGHPDRRVSSLGTSPTLADTDGDGQTDFEEYDTPARTPYLADLPRVEVELAGDIDVRLNIEYAESQGQQTEFGTTLAQSQSTTIANQFSTTVGFSYELALETDGEFKFPSSMGGGQKVTSTFGTSLELSYAFSKETSKQSSEEHSKVETNSSEYTQTASTGFIRTAVRFRNPGTTTFRITNINLLAKQVEKLKGAGDTSRSRSFKTIATLIPTVNEITLAPGELAGPFEMVANDVNASVIKELLANPDSLVLETASYEIENSAGLSYDFITEVTKAQTALVLIDFGDGNLKRYYIATNVDRNPDGTLRGITMRRFLEDVLHYPLGNPTTGFTVVQQLNAADQPIPGPKVLGSLLGYGPVKRPQGGYDYWSVASNHLERHGNVDFDKLVLKAGDELLLFYRKDTDNDGLPDSLETAAGTDQDPLSPSDADADGLTDRFETLDGWIVFEDPNHPFDPNDPNFPPHPDGFQYRRVYSDPRLQDTDGDGLDDYHEYLARSDPNNPDTDGDGLIDSVDPFPTRKAKTIYVNASAATSGNGLTWATAKKTINAALDLATAGKQTPADPSDDVSQIWVARGTYRPSSNDRNASFILQNQLSIYGGFSGPQVGFPGETKLGQRIANPYSNGTILSGDLSNNDTGDIANLGQPVEYADNSRTVVFADTPVNSSCRLDGFLITGAFNDESDARTENGTDDCGGNEVIAGTGIFIFQNSSASQAPDGTVTDICSPIERDVWFRWTSDRTDQVTIETVDLSTIDTVLAVYQGPDCDSLVRIACSDDVALSQHQSRVIFNATAGTQYRIRIASFTGTPGAQDQRFAIEYKHMGGGLFARGSPTLENLLFIRNVSQLAGAGLRVSGGSPTLTNCTFAGNLAQSGAGAFIRTAGTVLFDHCSFDQNEARKRPDASSDERASNGGGLAIYGTGRVNLNACYLSGNQAWNWGGGLFASDLYGSGRVQVTNCLFSSNIITRGGAPGNWGGAGGAAALFANASLVNSAFWNNKSTNFGGAVAAFRRLDLLNCTLSFNRSFVNTGFPALLDFRQGGGLFTARSDIGNNAYILSGLAGAVNIENTIAWQNWHGDDALPDMPEYNENMQFVRKDSAQITVRNSCFNEPNVYAGNNNTGEDPRMVNAGLGNFSLSADSHCVDRGNNYLDIDPLTPGLQLLPDFDLAGNPRILDGNGDGTSTVDIGAFEFTGASTGGP